MQAWFYETFPNVVAIPDEIWAATKQTVTCLLDGASCPDSGIFTKCC